MIPADPSRTESERQVLIFDGDCTICRRSVKWVRAADRAGVFELLPYQDPRVPERFPDIPEASFEGAMQLVFEDGRRVEGARAVEEILRVLPNTRPMSMLFRVPGVRRLAAVLYGAVARNRRRFGCGEHCAASKPRLPHLE